MSARIAILIVASVLFASLAGGTLGYLAFDWIYRKGRASSALSESATGRILLWLQGGIPILDELSGRLLWLIPALDDASGRLESYLAERGRPFLQRTLVSLLLCLSLVVGVVGGLVFGSPVFGVAVGLVVAIGAVLIVRHRGEKSDAAMREEVPDAIRSLEMSFRSGHSLQQTLAASAKEHSGYLGRLFSISADRLEMGVTVPEALSLMCDNKRIPELSFVAVALSIQHQSGGSIGPVLDSALDTVEGELKLMRNLRIQTAQAKLSAAIVTVMPFILVALFSMMSSDFLTPFFSSISGIVLLAIALGMQLAGVLLVRRVLRVDGVQ